jgi:hypothetical protein
MTNGQETPLMRDTSPTRRFWLSGKRAAEQDRFFREALEAQGWEEGDEDAWDAGWVTGMPDPAQFRRVSPFRKLNHFPGNAALTVKSRLHDGLAALRDRLHDSHGADAEPSTRLAFFPRAYVMPRDYHALQAAAQAAPDRRWILKPTNASKGKGVRVLHDATEAPNARDWLVQAYLDAPHTIRGHKYVLRLYVLIASLDPLRVYLYRQGFAKLASEPWDPEDADNPFSQLTNPDINARNDRAEVPVEFIDLDRYHAWLRDQGHDDDRLFTRLKDLVALTVISGVDAMRQRTAEAGADPRGGYELLGLDCLVDDTLRPWILECNLSPSLGTCAAPEDGGIVEERIKGDLVRDMIRLVDLTAEHPPASDDHRSDTLLAEARDEEKRAGGFERLLPASEPERYLPFFSLPSQADIRLADGLAGRRLPRPELRRRHGVELFDDDRLALYDSTTGHYYRPNDTATLIWLLATEGQDPDAITEALAQAARGGAASAPDLEAMRLEVWKTLGEWCRTGLLCQRGEGGKSPVLEPVDTPMGTTLLLSLDAQGWVLRLPDAASTAYLQARLGSRLEPLDDSSASALPRLTVLRDAAGYTLTADDEVLSSHLTLGRLAASLATHLMQRAALPGRPVLDATLLATASGEGVLCLLPGKAASPALLHGRPDAMVASRGVRLALGEPGMVEPLGLPVEDVAGSPDVELPERVAIRGVLLAAESRDTPSPTPVAMLEALGALLPRCLGAAGKPLSPDTMTALGDWLTAPARLAIPGDEGAVASLPAGWLSLETSEPLPVGG